MNIITTVLGAATIGLSTLGMTPIASATPMAPHESTYHGPEGFQLTIGHTDQSYRLVPPLNAMPTNREVFLNNTAYVTAPPGATGDLSSGYLVACAVDLELSVGLDGGISVDAGASVGFGSSGPDGSVDIGPSISAGLNLSLSMAPGEIKKIDMGSMPLSSGTTYLVNRDFHLMVGNCGGPLNVYSWATVTAGTGQVEATNSVFGDTMFL
ncbi:MspA family porin [Nocardia coubleae]|uniref:MspA family porin n=1 Tax=Nocardia coubleae TaxID=356147 RepID=A0A846WD20_9NOCA|nr:MspA family porin [Nocardia coubleae]NKX90566.1 MspA family porin [Nocardia coubleae]